MAADRKWAYIRMEGRNFGDVPLNVELKLEVWDSPNSAGVIIDAVRCAKIALDRGIGGPFIGPSAYFMKSPPVQFHDDVAHDMIEAFADGAENPSGRKSLNDQERPRIMRGLLVLLPESSHHSRRRTAASCGVISPSSRRISIRNSSASPTARARRDVQQLHDGDAVERRAKSLEVFVFAQYRRCALRVRPCAQPASAAFRALRVVQSQRVSSFSSSSSAPASRT